jgi:hypothetical protein
MSYGFDRAVLAGLLLYVVATIALGLRRRRPADEPEPVLTRSGITQRSQDSTEIASAAHR